MPIKKNPLTPRQTAMRLLQHMDGDVTYADIIRQVRILQDIDQTMNDVDLAGFGGDDVVDEARAEWEARSDSERPRNREARSESEKHPDRDARSESESRPDREARSESETPAEWKVRSDWETRAPWEPITERRHLENGPDVAIDSLLQRAVWRH